MSEMSNRGEVDRLVRDLAPKALGIVLRSHPNFADAEDAVQEAVIVAAQKWAATGVPERPVGWLVRVASRRLIGRYRSDTARQRREDLISAWSANPPEPASGNDDTLTVLFMCCHPALPPAAAIPLALRAAAGLTTREIAEAFMISEATTAQRISRAKTTITNTNEPFHYPPPDLFDDRLRSVLHIVYLLFNEGHTATSGDDLLRTEMTSEAVRLARQINEALPQHAEAAGLLALMLLTDARSTARTTSSGDVVPLDQQDRSLWDRTMITEGLTLLTAAMRQQHTGEYQLLAAIAAVHDQAPAYEVTRWPEISALYEVLERLTNNPMITLNRAIAVAFTTNPATALESLAPITDRLHGHHRYHAVRAHLHELAGNHHDAAAEYQLAAQAATNEPERRYLQQQAARRAH
jgi:RNA polymerase sigma factor (sigma-70 family)